MSKGAEEWLQRTEVRRRAEPPPGVFELALSLGGTVSAGAYTAGVLDFLIEALDQWDGMRGQAGVPSHHVKLRALSGASGGGVCSATLAKALAHDFMPERIADASAMPNPASTNPLYRSWVLSFDFDQMCRVPDPQPAQFDALLHPGPLTNPIDAPLGQPRSWVADPLTVLLTLTNLTGVPCRVSYTGEPSRGLVYTRCTDYARLEFFYRAAENDALCWPDAVRVKARPDADARGHPAAIEQSWDEAWMFARATSAYPVVFPVVELQRPAWHHLYQPVISPRADGGICVALDASVLSPAWTQQGQDPVGPYRFVAADGGILNNSPFELAHRELAGVVGNNPRAADTARRAVIHVDPLGGDGAHRHSRSDTSLTKTVGATLSALGAHARFGPQEAVLATEPEGHSRFLVGAVRSDGGHRIEGKAAVAGGALGGFSGFFSVAYRHHDFMLGRRNCQRFLHRHLLLAASNPSFGSGSGVEQVPVIPLLGTAKTPQPEPLWPTAKFQPDEASRPLRVRLRYVVRRMLPGTGTRWLLALVLLLPKGIAAHLVAWILASRGIDGIRMALTKHGLSMKR